MTKRTNADVIDAFLHGWTARAVHLETAANRLYSYYDLIAWRDPATGKVTLSRGHYGPKQIRHMKLLVTTIQSL